MATGLERTGHYKRRRREFLDFMNRIVVHDPDKDLHVILDNLNTHKPKHGRWLALDSDAQPQHTGVRELRVPKRVRYAAGMHAGRASILAGLYPHTAGPIVNQIVMSRDTKVIAEIMSEEYHTGYFGQWHLGEDVIRQHGFDEWVGTEDGHIPRYTQREYRTESSTADGTGPGAKLQGPICQKARCGK